MIIAGTGHRPNKLGGYTPDVSKRLFILAKEALLKLNPDCVISGGALGWDTELAAAAFSLRIPFTVAVPFKGQESRWPEQSRIRYENMLVKAKVVHTVCEGGYAGWKMQKRNEWMVDHCDRVLALWDGSSGGTANCVAYAEKVNKPIINLWSRWTS